MQVQKSIVVLAASVMTILVFTGCKKDNDEMETKQCRIVKIIQPDGTPIDYTYDQNGRIASMVMGNDTTILVYGAGTALHTTTSLGVFKERRTITNNSNGMAVNIRVDRDINGTTWTNGSYEYNGTQVAKTTVTNYNDNPPPSTSQAYWNNGNLITVVSSLSTTVLDYYTDKPAQQGDYLHLSTMLAGGYKIYDSKNLLKSITTSPAVTGITYEFDGDGKITKLTATTGGVVQSYAYQWQCD